MFRLCNPFASLKVSEIEKTKNEQLQAKVDLLEVQLEQVLVEKKELEQQLETTKVSVNELERAYAV